MKKIKKWKNEKNEKMKKWKNEKWKNDTRTNKLIGITTSLRTRLRIDTRYHI